MSFYRVFAPFLSVEINLCTVQSLDNCPVCNVNCDRVLVQLHCCELVVRSVKS